MRVPLDPSQWGMVVTQNLVSGLPAIEPYIMFAHLIDQDAEGNGFGLIPLMDGLAFIPFVIRAFELKPLDLLISLADGEEKFMNLSEPNALMATGGIPLGDPVTRMPPGVAQDQALNMFPPQARGMGAGGFGGGRGGRPDVYSSTTKIAGVQMESMELLLKAAKELDPTLPRFLAERWQGALETIAEKSASESRAEPIVALSPVGGGVDVVVGGEKKAALTVVEGAQLLRKMNLAEKVASLMAGEMVVVDAREKRASAFSPVSAGKVEVHTPGDMNAKKDPFIQHDGWYKVFGKVFRVFKTTYLDGRPCSHLLGVAPSGYTFTRALVGKPVAAPDTECMRQYLRPSNLRPGDMAFIVHDKTGEATIPFRVVAGQGGTNNHVKLTVEPILGDRPTVQISFGENRFVYSMENGSVAFPKRGYTVFKLGTQRMDPAMLEAVQPRPTRVKVFKGGGVYSIQEGVHAVKDGLNRGQLATLLISRYGFDPEAATAYIRAVDLHHGHAFDATPHEEPANHQAAFHRGAANLALRIFKMAKQAAGEMNPDPNMNGPNATPQAPGPSGPGPAGMQPDPMMMGGPNMMNPGAAIMPDVPNLQEVADMLSAYAMGGFAPDELSQIFNDLIDQLADVQDLTGRVLLLVRLEKIDFVTEPEAKRLLEESDKFRASLLNADMLLKGVGMAV